MLSLLVAILLTGSSLAAPTDTPAPRTHSCTSRSSAVREWTVSNFDFHASYIFTQPAHQNSWGYVNFTLSNSVVPYTAICQGSSNQLNDFFYGNFPYKCTTPGYVDGVTFTFSRPSGELKINQTWSCPDEGSWFEARGGIKLDLKCKDKKWQNPDWAPGQIYSTRNIDCEHVTVKAPISDMSGVA
ncbi:hypothetical protein XA68_15358 [Ophiocordyceps unilateralis]|uniref:AA1-like domain-containing protein n=1 Tax=Ophiocordyceps unilateralis TaxID=268505 RepID=A0A2A9PKK0_OPHUN|nr:hypothetical protein XA68_15358 [Ophiocordyceps unilateralis]